MTDAEFARAHDQWLEPPEEEPIYHCDRCGGDIYEDESYYAIDGKEICVECLRDFASDYFADCIETAERRCENDY